MNTTPCLVTPPLAVRLVLPALLLAAAPAAADWLVTVEGARVETRGAWTVARQQVVFTAANGTLSTLRLGEVDLAASREATAAAVARATPAEPAARPEKPRPVAVITDRDIPRGRPPAPSPTAAEAAGEEPAAEAVARTTRCLEVTFWRTREADDAIVLHGTLRNEGPHVATDLVLEVEVEDAARPGQWLKATAFLDDTTLAPGLTTTFRAVFPRSAEPQEPRFEVRCVDVAVRPAEAPGPASDAPVGDFRRR